jgi:Lamin Tail Domain
MKVTNTKRLFLAMTVTAAAVTAQNALAAIEITEVDPAGSANTAYAADWFELTNTGASPVSITGWKMDDNSNSYAA